MLRVLPALAAFVAVSTTGLSAPSFADPASAAKRAPLRGPVEFGAGRSVRGDEIAPFPVVLPGPAVAPAAVQRINAAFAQDRRAVEDVAAQCRGDVKESTGKPAPPDAWSRTVEATMKGPRYLSIMVTDSSDCGGSYPNFGMQTPLVYDLATGSPVNWVRLFPPEVKAVLGTASDGSKVGEIVWPELTRRAKAQAEAECKPVFDDQAPVGFVISLDARAGALDATPTEFPHVVQACENPVALKLADLRALHFSPGLIEALEAAHAAQR